MNKNNELVYYTEEQEKELQKAKQRAKDYNGLINQPYSELNNYIQFSIGDNVQAFMDVDNERKCNF